MSIHRLRPERSLRVTITRTRSQSVGCSASRPTVGPIVPAPSRTWRRPIARPGRPRPPRRGRRRSRPPRRCRASPAARDSGSQRSGRAGRDPDPGLLGAADRLSLPQPLERDQHLLAERDQLVPAGVARLVVPPGVGLGELGQVDARPPFGAGGPVVPRLLGGVRDDRGEQPGQGVVQPGQHELRGAAVGAVGRLGIEPVLQHVQVEARQLHRAELVDPLIDPVELEPFVGRPDVADHPVELARAPSGRSRAGSTGRPPRGRTAGSPRGCPAGSGTCCGSCDTPPTSP